MEDEKEIKKVFVYSHGDPSVGIFPVSLEIKGFDMIADKNFREFMRSELVECFSEILDDIAHVKFDFEMQEEIEREKELLNGSENENKGYQD
jgi:hypothetical protein